MKNVTIAKILARCILLLMGSMAYAQRGGQELNIPANGTKIVKPGTYFVIDTPASFAAGVTPIRITASDVELDLNGFTLTGPGGAGTGDDGILVTGATNVVIQNGSIESIRGNGIRIDSSTSILLEDILCRANAEDGFHITATSNSNCTISNCRSEGNGEEGFFDGGGSAISYKHCTAFNNTSDGFDITANNHVLKDCISTENTGLGLSSTGTAIDVVHCHFDENTAGGLSFTTLIDFCIQDCTFKRNSSTGLLFTTTSDGSVVRCCIIGNTGDGIQGTGTVEDPTSQIAICENTIINNTDKGITLDITVTQSCQIIHNKVVGNGTGQGSDGFGIDIGGGPHQFAAVTNAGFTLISTTHEVFGNFAKANGDNAAAFGSGYTPASDIGDTNYSNNVNKSPETGPQPSNGLVTTVASSAGNFQNITT